MANNFTSWLQVFLREKGVDMEESFEIENNFFTYGVVVEALNATDPKEQRNAQVVMMKLDFMNQDIKGYLRHLAQALLVKF